MFLYSVDYYEDLACCGYKRECQDFQKILQLLNREAALSRERRSNHSVTHQPHNQSFSQEYRDL